MPSYAEIALLLGVAINGIAVIGGLFISLRNGRNLVDLKKSTDGMKDELVAEVRQSAHAKGVKQEQDKHRHR
jgi:uncharacterized protein YrrD